MLEDPTPKDQTDANSTGSLSTLHSLGGALLRNLCTLSCASFTVSGRL